MKKYFNQRINIVNVNISNLLMDEAIDNIYKFIKDRGERYQIFTPNTDIIVKSYVDKNYNKVLNNADMLLPDGKPIIWASRFIGTPLKEKVSGSSLFFRICEEAYSRRLKIFLFGGVPGAAEKAMRNLNRRYGDIISGYYCPQYGFENDPSEIDMAINAIKESESDILIVGLGAPKQEYFINRYKNLYNVPVSLALGGTIDFASGFRKMPPEWLKNTGFGWLWRLLHEPKRLWKRYLIDDIKFFYYIIIQKYELIKLDENKNSIFKK